MAYKEVNSSIEVEPLQSSNDPIIVINNKRYNNIFFYFFIVIIISNFFILLYLGKYQFDMINYLLDKNQNKEPFKKLNLVNNIYFIIYYFFSTFAIFPINSIRKDSYIGKLKKLLFVLHFLGLLIKICFLIVILINNNNQFSAKEIIFTSFGDFIPLMFYLHSNGILFNK